jgi:hypothetical protein
VEAKRTKHCFSRGTELGKKDTALQQRHCMVNTEREKARCKERGFNASQGGFDDTAKEENCGLNTAC